MTKISAMSFNILRADVTIIHFQTSRPLTHYLLVVCIWSLQLFLSLPTLAVSPMQIRSFLIHCLLLRSSTRLDRPPSPLTTCLPLHSRWFPLILPLVCCDRSPRGLSAVPESFARPCLACGHSAPSSPHFPAATSAAQPFRRLLVSTAYKWFAPLLLPWRSSRVQGGRYYVQDLDPLRAPRGCESYLSRAHRDSEILTT